MKEVYGRARQLGKEGEFGECKRVGSRVQGENECGSKEIRKARFSRGKGLKKGGSCQRNIQQECCIDGMIRKFENEYLRRLERNQQKQKGKDKMMWGDEPTSSSRSRNLEREVMSNM